jgi:hypothetical protein
VLYLCRDAQSLRVRVGWPPCFELRVLVGGMDDAYESSSRFLEYLLLSSPLKDGLCPDPGGSLTTNRNMASVDDSSEHEVFLHPADCPTSIWIFSPSCSTKWSARRAYRRWLRR